MAKSDHELRHIANERYLVTVLAWLRQRLQNAAEGHESLGQPRFPAKAAAARELPALESLAARCGLSEFEKSVLLMCVAQEIDASVPGLCAAALPELNQAGPTAALCLALFDESAWNAFSPESPLRRWKLIDLERGNFPMTASPLRIDERLVNYLKGSNQLDAQLSRILSLVEETELDLPNSQQAVADQITLELRGPGEGSKTRRPRVIQLVGPSTTDKQCVASAVAGQLGLRMYRVHAAALPLADDSFLKLWAREQVLLPAALFVDASDLDKPGAATFVRLVERMEGILFCATPDRLPGLDGDTSRVFELVAPTPAEQVAAWNRYLPRGLEDVARQLAGTFELSNPVIARLASDRSLERLVPSDQAPALWQLCREQNRPRLEELAQRVDCRATWDDLVLAEQEMLQLQQIAAQVRHRGKVLDDWGFRQKLNRGFGVTALFAGESGTGKTMAAEVIANELQLDLYRIDLANVINKYIGETEKNLRRLFDSAEGGGAILFFDEADALFGKRSEVKDSHDRFANIETNYLLQRMESYRGLAILATNNKTALDHAFTRRLRFIVDFRFPEAAQRKSIWRRVFPTQTPLGAIDFQKLSQLRLSGGSIHNIALNAAYEAAAHSQLEMPHLVGAITAELQKTQAGVSFNKADLLGAERP